MKTWVLGNIWGRLSPPVLQSSSPPVLQSSSPAPVPACSSTGPLSLFPSLPTPLFPLVFCPGTHCITHKSHHSATSGQLPANGCQSINGLFTRSTAKLHQHCPRPPLMHGNIAITWCCGCCLVLAFDGIATCWSCQYKQGAPGLVTTDK